MGRNSNNNNNNSNNKIISSNNNNMNNMNGNNMNQFNQYQRAYPYQQQQQQQLRKEKQLMMEKYSKMNNFTISIQHFNSIYEWFLGIIQLIRVLFEEWNEQNPCCIAGFISRDIAIRKLQQ